MKKSLQMFCFVLLNCSNVHVSCLLPEVTPSNVQDSDVEETAIQNELYELSRRQIGSENPDPLLDVVGCDSDISEVRYIDAKTLINGMFIPEGYKKNLIDLLDSKDPTRNKEISCPLVFMDAHPTFKEHVINTFKTGIEECSVYRDLAIALMGYSNHMQQCTELGIYKEGKNIFEKGKELPPSMLMAACEARCQFTSENICCTSGSNHTRRHHNETLMYLTETVAFNHRCVRQESADLRPFAALRLAEYTEVMYHELGHALFQPIVSAVISNKDANDMHSISSNIVYIEHNDTYIDGCVQDLISKKQCVIYDVAKREADEKYYSDMVKRKNSHLRIGKVLFGDRYETCQILGFFVAKYNKKSILYINLLSDFNASLVSGRSIRIDHSGLERKGDWEDYINGKWKTLFHSESPSTTFPYKGPAWLAEWNKGPVEQATPNLSFMELLTQACGISMEEYTRRSAARGSSQK